MRLPSRSAANDSRIRYARYVARRLRRAKLAGEEEDVRAATAALASSARAQDEAEEIIQDALADRDAYDDELDDIAKRHRQTIEGRATNANRQRPYSDIYPDGIAWYTSAPLAAQATRYELLVRRYSEHLPDGDPVRAEAGALSEALAGWVGATAAVDKAELDLALARAKTRRAAEDWEQSLTRLYFRLAERFGKTAAERFYPKASRARRAGEVEVEPEAPLIPVED